MDGDVADERDVLESDCGQEDVREAVDVADGGLEDVGAVENEGAFGVELRASAEYAGCVVEVIVSEDASVDGDVFCEVVANCEG